MKTKFWILFLTLLGTIIQVISLTYESPMYLILLFIIPFGRCGQLLFEQKDKVKKDEGIGWLILSSLMFCWYLMDKNISDFFEEKTIKYLVLLITFFIARLTYYDSQSTHRKNLLLYGKNLVHIISCYINKDPKAVDRNQIDFQLWLNEVSKAETALMQELISVKYYLDCDYLILINNALKRIRILISKGNLKTPKKTIVELSTCSERKIAEEILIFTKDFRHNFSKNNLPNVNLSEYIKRADNIKCALKSIEDKDKIKLKNYGFCERFSNNS